MLFRLDPRTMTPFYVNHYFEQLNDPNAEQFPLTQAMMDNAITLSNGRPVLRGDPYHPQSVQNRQAEWDALKRQMQEPLAKKLGLNVNSPTSQQLLDNLDNTVERFIGQHRQAGIRSQMPSEFLGKTVREALESGNSTVRKLLVDSRWTK